jgi:DNA excision repair protein ERCC-3
MPEKSKPLIIQSDASILLDVHDPAAGEGRQDIAPFCELEKSPEHMHTYRITPISLWNAASAGIGGAEILQRLEKWTRFPVPDNVKTNIIDIISRFGKLVLTPAGGGEQFLLSISDELIKKEIEHRKNLQKMLVPVPEGFLISIFDRGTIKQELIKLGYPVDDRAPLKEGAPLSFSLRNITADGRPFSVRDYQIEAAEAFVGGNLPGSGYGIAVLPCGAGKTIVGMKAMEMLQTSTLILSTNVAAVHQWIDELLDKTSLTEEQIGEYSGETKRIRPVTAATYQIITWRPDKNAPFPHFNLFHGENWGLIIYDEVHLLPAPVFRVTAELQSTRRLGLTATLIREDGREDDVFSLVGPKRYDVPWKELEQKGWIAEASCYEIRVPLPEERKIPYAAADKRQKFRIASENPLKIEIVKQIIANHREDPILIIGQYLDQLREIAGELDVPIITGQTPNKKREEIYGRFKKGELRIIAVSKVANFAIDLPDASVAIQVSGTFGSRQEEAQRLGRILRPKERNSFFYSIISRYTTEEFFGTNRQKFLTEQGYKYHIDFWTEEEIGSAQ